MGEKNLYQLHMFVSGRVQGVGFRFYTIEKARKYGIKGWVKNLYDGRVEILAEGPKQNLLLFRQDIKLGPSMAYVSEISEHWEEIKSYTFDDFYIKYY
ncbi:MAG: acylphosphatase [Spirochaetes bacterium]|nr:MAG: acylphosphatase [Spirochaetota bacterium]